MKKIFILLGICIMLSFGMTVYGAEPTEALKKEEKREVNGDTLTKTMILPAGKMTLVPRYETDGNILYILDEDSIQIKTADTALAEGTKVVTVTRTITGLPDNDLMRIPMTEMQGKTRCDLLYATYKVTGTDEYKVPNEYEAFCCYAGLEKYSIDYDSDWEATMTYTGYSMDSGGSSGVTEYLYEQEIVSVQTERQKEKSVPADRDSQEETGEPEVMEEIEEPEDELAIAEKEGENSPKTVTIEEEETPLAGPEKSSSPASAGILMGVILLLGILVFILAYVCFYTAPIYAAIYSGGYKRLGRIWLRRRKDHYEAILSEYLIEKAEIDRYKIKISRYIQNRSGANILDIRCPDGTIMTRKLAEEVLFALED